MAAIYIALLIIINLNSSEACLSSVRSQIQSKPTKLRNSVIGRQRFTKSELFSRYLFKRYRWKMTPDDVDLLYEALREFETNNKANEPNNVYEADRNFKTKKSQSKPFISLSKLRRKLSRKRKDTMVIGGASSSRLSKVKKKPIRVFSRYEAKLAWSMSRKFNDPKKGPCRVKSQSFCMKSYFNVHENKNNLQKFYPPSLPIKRCSQKQCDCLKNDHECLPIGTVSRTFYAIGIDKNYATWTWAFYMTDHSGCKCQPKCQTRQCIDGFQMRISTNKDYSISCHCECKPGYDKQCKSILGGQMKFSAADYFCIVSGKCLKPQCYNGDLSDEHLYNRQCSSLSL